jgi:hypothetical protein
VTDDPDFGSDLGGITTRATPANGGWVINGRQRYFRDARFLLYNNSASEILRTIIAREMGVIVISRGVKNRRAMKSKMIREQMANSLKGGLVGASRGLSG